jgi:hypothetical protein
VFSIFQAIPAGYPDRIMARHPFDLSIVSSFGLNAKSFLFMCHMEKTVRAATGGKPYGISNGAITGDRYFTDWISAVQEYS